MSHYNEKLKRKTGVNLVKLSIDELTTLSNKVEDELYDIYKYPYFCYDERAKSYYQTSNYKKEGISLVRFKKFCETHSIK